MQRKNRRRLSNRTDFVSPLESRLLMATFPVTNTNDSGAGSLRQAVINANAAGGLDNITFNIGGGGVQSIALLSALPELTSPVNIDGTTQPGFSSTPIIELNGASAGSGSNAFRLRDGSGGSTIRGLVINRFGSDAIDISQGDGNVIAGNFIGTDVTGTIDRGNQDSGVDVGTDNNRIGGTTAADRNLISGNSGEGVALAEDPDDSVNNNQVLGNFIGTDITGTNAIPNNQGGVRITQGFNNRVGDLVAGSGNLIAFNGGDGISVISGNNNRFLANSIFNNQDLGIDLGNNGVTPNDAGDADVGQNQLQNFPVLNLATRLGANTTVRGTLNSTPNSTFRLEFFAATNPDPSGFGEGRRFLGATSVTTDNAGNASFVAVVGQTNAGEFVTSTATSGNGANNTSEFSANRNVFLAGDADGNGVVNFDDFAAIDNGFNNNLTGFSNGDFDGNGVVNFDDFAIIDQAFNTQ